VTFAIGALATSGAWHVSAVAAVVVLALLRFKQLLHAGVGKLSEAEISSGTQLLLISGRTARTLIVALAPMRR
jgi:uncharacterized membrane protein (DUF4010 family)